LLSAREFVFEVLLSLEGLCVFLRDKDSKRKLLGKAKFEIMILSEDLLKMFGPEA